MLLIFLTLNVSNLVNAAELNSQNSPSSKHLFCILKIPDTEYLFLIQVKYKTFQWKYHILKIMIVAFSVSS